MKTGNDDTPVIGDYTYYVFEQIEQRGLQFYLPAQWKPLYVAFLKERKRKREIVRAFDEFARSFGSEATRYLDDFGDKGAKAREENSKANNTTRPL